MIKEAIVNIIISKPLRQILYRFDPQCGGVILYFHRVHPKCNTGLFFDDDLNVSPEYFEKLLLSFQRNGYSFISIDELYDNLRNKKSYSKTAVITFDDGYHEFMDNVLPILESFKIPAIIYFNTGNFECNNIYWWVKLARIISEHDKLFLPRRKPIFCRTYKEKQKCFSLLRPHFLKLQSSQRDHDILSIIGEINCFQPDHQLAMSQDDILILLKNPLITFGNHTHSHLSGADVDLSEYCKDFLVEQDLFKKRFNIDLKHFSYPYGTIPQSRDAFEIFLKHHGIKTAVTTFEAVLSRFNVDHFYSLPRVFVSELQNFSVESMDKKKAITMARSVLLGKKY